MSTNLLILLPSMKAVLEPPVMGRLMGTVMKRLRTIVYISIVILGVTGIVMNLLNKNYLGLMNFGNTWSMITLVKHVVTAALVILVIYAFETLAPKISRLAAKGPSPEFAHLQKKQIRLAIAGFILGIIILLLTGIITAISSVS
jgi:uncharacterized membrane protein